MGRVGPNWGEGGIRLNDYVVLSERGSYDVISFERSLLGQTLYVIGSWHSEKRAC